MIWYLVKLLVSALIIVLVSEVSKKLPLIGSLIASIPLISVLGMIWMYGEKVNVSKIASHAEGTFWYVLPSLPMFLVLPWMLRKGFNFPLSITACIALTGILYVIMTKVLTKFGLNL